MSPVACFQKRAEWLCVMVVFVVVLLALRMIQLQQFLRDRNTERFVRREIFQPRRAGISDRTGVALAVDTDQWAVCANPRAIASRATAARCLADLLHLSYNEVLQKLSKVTRQDGSKNYYVPIKKRITKHQAETILELAKDREDGRQAPLSGVYLVPFSRRTYPLGSRACQLLGFVSPNTGTWSVWCSPHVLASGTTAAAYIEDSLGLPRHELSYRLGQAVLAGARDASPVLVKDKATPEDSARLRLMQDRWLRHGLPSLEGIYLRSTSLGEFSLQSEERGLLGFLYGWDFGQAGIELRWDECLAGDWGYREAECDALRRPVPAGYRILRPTVSGKNITLTIDERMQAYAEAALAKCHDRYNPRYVCAALMRPRTGEILAMATKPDFDLNHVPAKLNELSSNRPVSFMYEPGSTFKLITASAVIEKLNPPANQCFCCDGLKVIGGHTIHCWVLSEKGHGHRSQTLADAIKNSCNIAISGFALELGEKNLFEYVNRFGFRARTGIACPSERRGKLTLPGDWGNAKLCNVAFGQGVLITPLQLLTAVSAIANGGVRMRPYIVHEIRTVEGHTVSRGKPQVVQRVTSPDTARRVTEMMVRVVQEGTGKLAAVPGYRTAGKTGSAQKALSSGGYAPGKFVSSFVGFLPAEDPELAILVVADEPKGAHWGSVVCGPVFREIAEKSMLRLRMNPHVFEPSEDAGEGEREALPSSPTRTALTNTNHA